MMNLLAVLAVALLALGRQVGRKKKASGTCLPAPPADWQHCSDL
jgi:hypothetical protein